jgi:Protein of unknown function (DUF3224)
VSYRATGKFVNLTHDLSAFDDGAHAQGCARLTARRQYSGDVGGESVGDMLTCQTGEMRFGYVGMDCFVGTLNGRSGSFVFQHGEMNNGGDIRAFGFIIDGSGTGELQSISGHLEIKFVPPGDHTITFDYSFTEESRG